jgi:dTMP kinase
MIIAFEGGDACGKATQTKLLAERLKAKLFSFPDYSTLTGKLILGHLKKHWVCAMTQEGLSAQHPPGPHPLNDLTAATFQALMTVNRLELLPQILEARTRGNIVFDRYYKSGLVYGKLDFLDPAWIKLIQAPLPEPDVWILLDVPVEEGFRRRPERRDRSEQDRTYLERVRLEYLHEFGYENDVHRYGWTSEEYREGYFIVNGTCAVEEVHRAICGILRGRFGRDFLDDKEFYGADGRLK